MYGIINYRELAKQIKGVVKMIKFNNENEMKIAWAEHMNKSCQDDFYLNDLNRVQVNSLRGGYTPMNMKDMGVITKSKYILYIQDFGYTEVA